VSAPELRRTMVGIVVVLQVQFLLGMAVNLFVMIPTQHPGARPPEYFGGVVQSVSWAILQGPPLLILHASLGLLLVLAAAGVAIRAWRSGGGMVRWTTVLGALFILAAGFNGGSFLNYNEDFSSMIMAALFALAVVSYALALAMLSPTPQPAAGHAPSPPAAALPHSVGEQDLP
jgi:hypothetical protein